MSELRTSVGDRDDSLRRAAFALLLTKHHPVSESQLAIVTGITSEAISQSLSRLSDAGRIDRAEDGQVVGSQGLTLASAPHRITLGEEMFHTWCAYDALGIAAALEADARIETRCPVCRRTLAILTRGGYPDRERPERLWLADGGADLRDDFCASTVLLCSEDHAHRWAQAHGGRGNAVTLADGAQLGAVVWRPSAELAQRMGYAGAGVR